MIFTADHPAANYAQIWDASGNNICDYYLIKWYNTITQVAGIMEFTLNEKGVKILKPDGLGGIDMNFIHFPGSKLVIVGPANKIFYDR